MVTVCFVCGLTADESGGLKQIQMFDHQGKPSTVHVCTNGPCEAALLKKPEVDLQNGKGYENLPDHLRPQQ